jgi:hypothetical protein
MYEGSELLVLPQEVMQMFPPHSWILKVVQEEIGQSSNFILHKL